MAVNLRDQGWIGRIVLVGNDARMPYHRPPLSKAYMTGEADAQGLLLRPEPAYERARVECRFGAHAKRIDRMRKMVSFSDGSELGYTKLVLATGGRPRMLDPSVLAHPCENVHVLNAMDDAEGIRRQLLPGARLVVIGAGYIGLEVAASAAQLGLAVTVIEACDRVLARVTAPEVSKFFEQVHREAGVDLRVGTAVERLELQGNRVTGVCTKDGTVLPADLVLVGIGQIPNVELAQAAGLAVDNGVLVDEFTVTSDPDIMAIGDCSNYPGALYQRRLRVASVPNALEQARTAAAFLCGKRKPHHSVPWFWSDQFDLKFKIVGLSQGYDALVIRGRPEDRSFAAFYLQGDRVLAADTVNRQPEFMLAKRLVGERIPVSPHLLADESVALKSLLSPTTSSISSRAGQPECRNSPSSNTVVLNMSWRRPSGNP